MKTFSFHERQLEKEKSRQKDEQDMKSGKISHLEMTNVNGGHVHNCRYIGPSIRIQELAKKIKKSP